MSVFGHFIAFAIENETNILNPGFFKYAELFTGTKSNLLCRYPKKVSNSNNGPFKIPHRLRRIIYTSTGRLIKLSQKAKNNYVNVVTSNFAETYVNMSEPEFLFLARKKILFCRGYFFRDYANVNKHAEKIKKYFVPVDSLLDKVKNVHLRIKNNYNVIIGVHIRQGDYRAFKNGQWFFETSTYVRAMRHLNSLFDKNQKVVFLICSDTKQDDKNFSGLNYIINGGGMVEDLYSLSMCDYIIGPPSSYSRWASFYGNVPLGVLNTRDAQLSFSDFKINDRLTG